MEDDNLKLNQPTSGSADSQPFPDNNSTLKTQDSKLVLGLVGSPRKLGNCEVITKEISRNIPVPHRLSLIRLPSFNILPCHACYACIMDQPCPNKDDMQFLLQRVAEADAMIITSPVYYLGAHSIFKRVLDRGFLFFNVLKETWGKPCILINVYGMEGRIGVASHTLMTLARFLGLDIKESLNFEAALPGEIVMDEAGERKAKHLGELLFSEESTRNDSGCPFCGSEIVRMREGKFICALCHGLFTTDDKGKTIRIKEGDIFGSLDHMLRHREWLRGMKDRFLRNRKEIIKTISRFKNVGEWIEPQVPQQPK
jgi:multimeric flavodoxin WrbA